jgi:hypothetical protein
LPPHYVKHVGRPNKERRAPGEIDARVGGRRITRHGVIIQFSCCGEPDHNRGGCKWLKEGPVPPSASNSSPQPTQEQETQDFTATTYTCTHIELKIMYIDMPIMTGITDTRELY